MQNKAMEEDKLSQFNEEDSFAFYGHDSKKLHKKVGDMFNWS